MDCTIVIIPDRDERNKSNMATMLSVDESSLIVLDKITENHQVNVDFSYMYSAFDHVSDGKHLLLIKNSTTSPLNGSVLKTLINNVCSNLDYDIFYLAKWLDRCDQRSSTIFTVGEASVVKTSSPNGFQAVLMSPLGISRIKSMLPRNKPLRYSLSLALTSLIEKTRIRAYTTSLSVMIFDPVLARSKDYIKTQECADVSSHPLRPVKPDQGFSLMWFIIICIFSFFVLYLLLKLEFRMFRTKTSSG